MTNIFPFLVLVGTACGFLLGERLWFALNGVEQ